MPRPLRLHYPNACYHVMNRGAGRKKIFRNDKHRHLFLNLLSECHETFNLIIYAYCLMDNHYHLLVSTPEANLANAMKHLSAVYTQKFNYSMNSDGALFRGRYKAKIVEEDCYRLLVSRYIHMNPVKAGMVSHPEDYIWSSYRAYLSLNFVPEWLDTNSILKQLSETTSLSHIKNYQEYVAEKDTHEINIYQSTKHIGTIIGSQNFKDHIIANLDNLTAISCDTEVKRARMKVDMNVIKSYVCDAYKTNIESLNYSKKGTRNLPKLVYIYICRKHFGYTLKEISQTVGFNRHEAVSVAVSKLQVIMKNDPALVKMVSELTSKIKLIGLDDNKS